MAKTNVNTAVKANTPVKKAEPEQSGKKQVQYEVIEGVAMYAFLHQPDKGNPKRKIGPAYKIEVMLDDKTQLKFAESLGLKIKEPTEKFEFPYISVKSKVKEGRNGPRVMDSKRNIIPADILIGNGSRVKVRFLPFEYGEGEVTAILQEVMVTKLVRYEGGNNSGFLEPEEDGFSVDEAGSSDDDDI
jgi:hypothetical protein